MLVQSTDGGRCSKLVDQDVPTLVASNFNCIDDPQEKKGGKPFTDKIGMKEFRDFIMANGLVDLGFSRS